MKINRNQPLKKEYVYEWNEYATSRDENNQKQEVKEKNIQKELSRALFLHFFIFHAVSVINIKRYLKII